jgi:ribosome modulation factor
MTPFEQGYKAFLEGKPKDDNKFTDKEPWSREKWSQGWARAQDDKRAKR